MLTALSLSLVLSLASSQAHAAPAFEYAEFVGAGQEISVGQVIGIQDGSQAVVVRERRAGWIQDSAVSVSDPQLLFALQPGATVLVYREDAGALVVPAR